MPIKWNEIRGLSNHQEIDKVLRKKIVASNYYSEKNSEGWSLTELIKEPSGGGMHALQIIMGHDRKGRTRGDIQPLTDNGLPFLYRLKVLTRQACSRDKDGTIINGWDKDQTEDYEDYQSPDNDFIIVPGPKDEPCEGDIVRIKGDFREKDEDGNLLNKQYREYALENGKDIHHYKDVAIDKDGCITVDFNSAMQLLKLNGMRVVKAPRFRKRDKVKDQKKEPQRQIVNWLYEEVPREYKKKKQQSKNTQTQQVLTN